MAILVTCFSEIPWFRQIYEISLISQYLSTWTSTSTFFWTHQSSPVKEVCNTQLSYINNSLHLVRKYARIFVRGHYLFRVANRKTEQKLQGAQRKSKGTVIFRYCCFQEYSFLKIVWNTLKLLNNWLAFQWKCEIISHFWFIDTNHCLPKTLLWNWSAVACRDSSLAIVC